MKKKKLLLTVLLIGSSLFAKEPVWWGVSKGDLKSYYPNISVTNAYLISNSATTGITASKPQSLMDTTNSFMNNFKKEAKRSCKNSYGYALDHFQTQYTTFGEYSNTFIYVSANVVCFNK
jgi:hypothetical protein